MTDTTRAALAQALDALKYLNNKKLNSGATVWVASEIDLLTAALAAPQEPVAWHVCSVNSDGSLSLEHAAMWREAAHEHISEAIDGEIEGASSWVVRPVYYAAPAALARQPLTRDRVKIMTIEAGYGLESPACRAAFIDGIRHAERAHNITGDAA